MREAYIGPGTGRVRGVALDVAGDVPKITEAGLGRALDVARATDRSTVLSQQALAGLDPALDALRRQGIVQSLKRSATAGGGSNTASDLLAQGATRMALDQGPGARGTVLRGAIDAADALANARRDAPVAQGRRGCMTRVRCCDWDSWRAMSR
jgi:hypothetical protein